MRRIHFLITAIVLMCSAATQAQLTFSGPAVYVGDSTDLGFSSVPAITVTSPSTGIDLTGFYHMNAPLVPPGGNMLSWYVDRPIAGGTSSFNITTTNIGNVNITGAFTSSVGAGILRTQILRSGAVIAEAAVSSPFSGAATPISAFTTVTVTGYSYVVGDFLRLSYISQVGYTGSGFVYDVDFPAIATITAVPEPTTAALIFAVTAGLGRRRRRNRDVAAV